MKVFVSYKWESEAHQAWVRRLSGDLRSQGIEAILDQWELRLGDSLSTYMATNVQDSDAVLFIISPGFIEAASACEGKGGAVQFEMQMSMARKLRGDSCRLIGLIRGGDSVPPQLSDNLYLDFTNDCEYDTKLATLVNDLLGKLDKPALAETDDPILGLTRRIQDCFQTATGISNAAFQAGLTGGTERHRYFAEAKELRDAFVKKTSELANFQSSNAYALPPHIYNIVYMIFRDLIQYELYITSIRQSELHRPFELLQEYTVPKIRFLHHVLRLKASGKICTPPSEAPPQTDKRVAQQLQLDTRIGDLAALSAPPRSACAVRSVAPSPTLRVVPHAEIL